MQKIWHFLDLEMRASKMQMISFTNQNFTCKDKVKEWKFLILGWIEKINHLDLESLKPLWIPNSMQLLGTYAWLQEKEMQLSSTFYLVWWSDLQTQSYTLAKMGVKTCIIYQSNPKSMKYSWIKQCSLRLLKVNGINR